MFRSLSNNEGIFALGIVEKQGQLFTSHGKHLNYTNWYSPPKPWISKKNSGKFIFFFEVVKKTTKNLKSYD